MEVVLELKKVGYDVQRVWQKPPFAPGARIWSFYKKVPLEELALLTRELAMFFSSGIGLIKGLESIEGQGFSRQTAQAARDVARGLEDGRGLAQSMALRPDVFRPVYIKLIHAGEMSGALEAILHRLSDHLERELLLKRKLNSALAYPALIFLVCVGLIAFLIFFLFPLFVSFFSGLNSELPAITTSLVAVVEILRHPLSIGLLVLTPFLLGRLYEVALRSEAFLKWYSELILDIPVVGKLKRSVLLARFCSTMAILLDSGVLQITALSITADALGNKYMEGCLRDVSFRIKNDGDSLYEALKKEEVFPQLLCSLVMVGEEVGNLPRVLELAHETYDTDVSTDIERFTVLLEPLMLLVMGGIVGYVLLAVFLPIYSMLNAL